MTEDFKKPNGQLSGSWWMGREWRFEKGLSMLVPPTPEIEILMVFGICERFGTIWMWAGVWMGSFWMMCSACLSEIEFEFGTIWIESLSFAWSMCFESKVRIVVESYIPSWGLSWLPRRELKHGVGGKVAGQCFAMVDKVLVSWPGHRLVFLVPSRCCHFLWWGQFDGMQGRLA